MLCIILLKPFKCLWEENPLYQNDSLVVYTFLCSDWSASYVDFAINIILHYLQQGLVWAKQITYSAPPYPKPISAVKSPE